LPSLSRISVTATFAPSFANKIQVSRPIQNAPPVIIKTLFSALFMLEFIIIKELNKINCIKNEEVTELLKIFTLFTFLDPDTSLSETLHTSSYS